MGSSTYTPKCLSLPRVRSEPAKLHGSCTFISTSLIDLLSLTLCHGCSAVVSIGSGRGLLEALLHQANPAAKMICVEVEGYRRERKYVPEDSMVYVPGTWKACNVGLEAEAWLFAYPRTPALIDEYVSSYAHGKVGRILWIGPRDDASDFRSAVRRDDFDMQDFGRGVLQPNEAAFLWTRTPASAERILGYEDI